MSENAFFRGLPLQVILQNLENVEESTDERLTQYNRRLQFSLREFSTGKRKVKKNV